MARKSKSEKLRDIHDQAIRNFAKIQSAVSDEREQCLEDRRFYSIAGAQWEGALSQQFENRPRLEVNKVHLGVMRIINEYRNNRITVEYVPKDGKQADELADVCMGLYRADEKDSCADEAYDNAFEEAVGGGFGAWRLCTEYEDPEDPDDDRQRIRIEPIYDADKFVFFDLNAKRQDKSDAKHCYVLTAMTPDAYEEEFGEEYTPSSMPSDIDMTEFDWDSPNVVYVAEYYCVEHVTEIIRVFEDLAGNEKRYTEADFEEDETLEQFLMASGATELPPKRVKRKKVRKYIMDGARIIEDLGYIAGTEIPIVPVYGKRWYIDNRERMMGHVRMVKDAQRLKNMQLSRLAEISAYSTVQKPIFSPEQVAGYEVMWREDNIKNYPYLLINPVTNVDGSEALQGAADYTRSPEIPPAMAALLQVTEVDIQDLLGKQEMAQEVAPNVSGTAMELAQTRLDQQNFIYMSNMAKAVRRSGEIWLSMARDTLVEEKRRMKVLDDKEQPSSAMLSVPVLNPKTSQIEIQNDIKRAKFDVSVDVGPASQSRRLAVVRALTNMLQITPDPETQVILTSMALMNMEGEGLGDARKFFRKRLVNMGVLQPNEEEMAQMQVQAQNQGPNPQEAYLMAAAAEAEAKAGKAQADAAHVLAKTQETEAKTLETLAGIDRSEQQNVLDMLRFQQEQEMARQTAALQEAAQQTALMGQQPGAPQQPGQGMREPEARPNPLRQMGLPNVGQ